MSDEQKLLDAVQKFGQDFLERHPEFVDMIESARVGSFDAKEVVKAVWKAAAENKDFQDTVEKAVAEAFGVDGGPSSALARMPEREKMLERWGFTDEDLVFQPFEDRPNYKMLHPMLMARIVELIQFDGDIPELRTGMLPEGGSPAVPVKTNSRDPVVIGAMLRTASKEVALELAEAKEVQDKKVAAMIGALPPGEVVSGLVRQETEKGLAVPGYAPGKKAAIREVTAPTSMELARMPFAEKQELAHKALTSTQGRRSAVPVIADMVLAALSPMVKGGMSITQATDRPPLAQAEWGMQIDGGTSERNPNFNFIDTAARSLTIKLRRELRDFADDDGRSYELVVAPINTVNERRVGWKAALYAS